MKNVPLLVQNRILIDFCEDIYVFEPQGIKYIPHGDKIIKKTNMSHITRVFLHICNRNIDVPADINRTIFL